MFAIILAATTFSKFARGLMFSVVIWQEADIAHIKVFPARDNPAQQRRSYLAFSMALL